MNKKTIISAKQWKEVSKEIIREIKLPSGVSVKVKNLNLLECAASGHIPLQLVNESMQASGKMAQVDGWKNMTEKDLESLIEITKKVAIFAVVEPIVSDNPQDGEMNVNDINLDDRLSILTQATTVLGREVENDLKPFLKE